MNSESRDEMREEYEFRPGGGVRGKYYDRYIQGATIRLVFSSEPHYVVSYTSSTPSIGAITKTVSSPFNIDSLFPVTHEG